MQMPLPAFPPLQFRSYITFEIEKVSQRHLSAFLRDRTSVIKGGPHFLFDSSDFGYNF